MLLVAVTLIRSSSPTVTSEVQSFSTALGSQDSRALALPSDDYYDTLDPVSTVPPRPMSSTEGRSFQRCKYDRCVDNQLPCDKLAAATGCLCPGFTLYNQLPDPPDQLSLSWNGSEVLVRWCSPYSHVTGYVVTVGGEARRRFGENQRSGGVGDIQEISEVCVVAENDAGFSDDSCTMFRPRSRSVAVRAGLIAGGLGLLLLLLLATAIWGGRRRHKGGNSVSMASVQDG
ncbi:leucine-rich repeat neuronal protein 4 [Synchiropus picturatus]